MSAYQIFYFIMFLVVIYFVYKNIKDRITYKKENMEVLLLLDEDDKGIHLMSKILMVVLIVLAIILIIGLINTDDNVTEETVILILLPILMVTMYIPLSKKTMVSTLGIHKRANLIRWENIKGIQYMKPDEKNKVRVKITYSMSKDVNIDLKFKKNDPQLPKFKDIAKDNRKTKKKGRKNDK